MNIPSILKEIVMVKKKRLERQKTEIGLEEMTALAKKAGNRPGFCEALKKDGLSIIGEIKKASPSKGLIKEDFDPIALAREYKSCVDALSVLTEEDYFLGSPQCLRDVVSAVNLPTLRKDFIFDEYQIYEAKALGASAVLLIAAILSEEEMKAQLALARSLGMEALVETHSIKEMEAALNADAHIIGINNRDLNTFHVDLQTTIDIASEVPEGMIKVSESGFHSAEDIKRIKDSKIDAILVGESFMKSTDMKQKAREFRDAFED
jgi:indole-3-glycerol phosphate synthase